MLNSFLEAVAPLRTSINSRGRGGGGTFNNYRIRVGRGGGPGPVCFGARGPVPLSLWNHDQGEPTEYTPLSSPGAGARGPCALGARGPCAWQGWRRSPRQGWRRRSPRAAHRGSHRESQGYFMNLHNFSRFFSNLHNFSLIYMNFL